MIVRLGDVNSPGMLVWFWVVRGKRRGSRILESTDFPRPRQAANPVVILVGPPQYDQSSVTSPICLVTRQQLSIMVMLSKAVKIAADVHWNWNVLSLISAETSRERRPSSTRKLVALTKDAKALYCDLLLDNAVWRDGWILVQIIIIIIDIIIIIIIIIDRICIYGCDKKTLFSLPVTHTHTHTYTTEQMWLVNEKLSCR